MSNQLEKIKELIERRAVARIGGGEKAIAKQHEKGKYYEHRFHQPARHLRPMKRVFPYHLIP